MVFRNLEFLFTKFVIKMKKFQVLPSCKKGSSIAKFTINPPLSSKLSRTFINIDQAYDAPLVKQLFFLPFVKKVVLEDSTLIVERFDILEWEEVIQEVTKQIEDFLNSGGNILDDVKKVEKVAIINVKGKSKSMSIKSSGRTIRTEGKKSSWKKAVVTLFKDDTIDLTNMEF